jgi:hypothetical protein
MNDDSPSAPLPVVAPHAVLRKRNLPDWRIWFGLALTVAWLIVGALYVETSMGWHAVDRQPADVIGSFLEGAFAPLAFLWLVIGYFLQHKSLAQNTEALQMQFQEIQRTAEQAVRQTETITASERHARQETFLRIAGQVRQQLGAILGLLFMSSQGSAGNGQVADDAMDRYWSDLYKGDPEIFARLLLTTHVTLQDPADRFDLFYGTEIRARHANNFIFTLERLLARAREADTDGILEDLIVGSAHGFVYKLTLAYRDQAPERLASVASTGRDVRFDVASGAVASGAVASGADPSGGAVSP